MGRIARGRDSESLVKKTELEERSDDARGEVTGLQDREREPVHGPIKSLVDKESTEGRSMNARPLSQPSSRFP